MKHAEILQEGVDLLSQFIALDPAELSTQWTKEKVYRKNRKDGKLYKAVLPQVLIEMNEACSDFSVRISGAHSQARGRAYRSLVELLVCCSLALKEQSLSKKGQAIWDRDERFKMGVCDSNEVIIEKDEGHKCGGGISELLKRLHG